MVLGPFTKHKGVSGGDQRRSRSSLKVYELGF